MTRANQDSVLKMALQLGAPSLSTAAVSVTGVGTGFSSISGILILIPFQPDRAALYGTLTTVVDNDANSLEKYCNDLRQTR